VIIVVTVTSTYLSETLVLRVVAGIVVVIGRFQWVGVMDHAGSIQAGSQSDVIAAAAAAADDDDDNKAASSPCMQYFIQVLLFNLMSI